MSVPRHVVFLGGVGVLFMGIFTLARLGLLIRNGGGEEAVTGELVLAFVYGLRFDLSITCYLLMPFTAAVYGWLMFWPSSRAVRRWMLGAMLLCMCLLVLAQLAEFEFFAEFRTRYNQLAVRYLAHAMTVGGMVIHGYPVLRYMLIWLSVGALIFFGLRWLARQLVPLGGERRRGEFVREAVWLGVLIGLMAMGARGGLQGEPLRWGAAFWSQNEFVNQLTLNGFFSLSQAMRDAVSRGRESAIWMKGPPIEEARAVVRAMVMAPGQKLLSEADHSVLRSGTTAGAPHLVAAQGRRINVVVVMMESFSARYSGSCGAPESFTPAFDALARGGMLYTRALSNGSHTHQGIFSTQLGFPVLPGYETLMESESSNQQFASLPKIFAEGGYQTMFLYNGDFDWDNMYGFFRKQGIQKFIGRDEMKAEAEFVDDVWGVSDGDLFDRAIEEFEKASENGPFYAAIMTLSNHAPFQVPPVPGAAPIVNQGEKTPRLTAVRYADYAVGRFIQKAREKAFFKNTLFVFVGDHGFHVSPVLTEVHLIYHHVPLLFYAPEMTTSQGKRLVGSDDRIATQANILPTILDLMDMQDAKQSAWARSLMCTEDEASFAVFKMSGGGRAVAIADNKHILLLGAGSGKPELLEYSLGFPPSIRTTNDREKEKLLEAKLRGYLQAGLYDLAHKCAGPKLDGG